MKPSTLALQPGLYRTWSEITKTNVEAEHHQCSSAGLFFFFSITYMHFVPNPVRKPPVEVQLKHRLIHDACYLLGLYGTWSETTMLNIATAQANMISVFWIALQMLLNLTFKTSSNMQMLYNLVCVEDKYKIRIS